MLFCKFAGIIFVMGASGYFAVNLNRTMENRGRELRRLYSLLLQLKSEIQYMSSTLPDCFRKLSSCTAEPFKDWLDGLAGRMEEKSDIVFSELWKEELERLCGMSSMQQEDLEPVLELADKLGGIDLDAQLKAIDYALLHIEKNRSSLENELNQKKKVVMTLSLFAGFMVLILLL